MEAWKRLPHEIPDGREHRTCKSEGGQENRWGRGKTRIPGLLPGAASAPEGQHVLEFDGSIEGGPADGFSTATTAVINVMTDADLDGLTDAREAELGSNPNKADTDGDGMTDGAEALAGTNPLEEGSEL